MDKIDKQILEILTLNSRTPYSAIAKTLKLSKSAIINRITKLQQQGCYKNDLLIVDSRVFGYTIYQIFIQLEPEVENKDELFSRVSRHPRTLWSNSFIGNYNLQIIIDAKNPRSFTQIKEELFQLCENKIKKYTVLTHIYDIEFSQLNPQILNNIKIKKKNDSSFSNLFPQDNLLKKKKIKNYYPSLIEVEILNQLATNPRMQLQDIATNTNIDRKTVKKKIAHLIEKNVISSFTTVLDTTKFGYLMYTMMVKLKPNTSDEVIKKSFSKINNLFYSARFFGEYDLLIYLYAKTPEELDNTLEHFEKNMGPNIVETQLLITNKVLNWRQFSKGLYKELKKELL